MILARFPIVLGRMTFRAIDSLFILKLGLNELLPWSFERVFCMGRVKKEENFTDDKSYQTINIYGWHVMGLYTRKWARVDQLLHWEFVPILNKISNIMTDGKNNGCRMFTRDSQPLHVQVCFIMSTFKKVIQIQTPNIPFMKEVTGYTSHLAIFYSTLSSIFGFTDPFQLLDSSLCLTSIEPYLAIYSIKKLQMEWCLSFLN